MKKLNRKGFTLVELLAVIIILAIVVGITIPAITNIINDSKNNALGVAVDAASDYLTDQYGYMNIDRNTATSDFITAFGAGQSTATYGYPTPEGGTNPNTISEDLLEEMGFDKDNVVKVKAELDGTKICVTVEEVQKTSEYYSTDYWTATAGNNATKKTDATTKNSNCE